MLCGQVLQTLKNLVCCRVMGCSTLESCLYVILPVGSCEAESKMHLEIYVQHVANSIVQRLRYRYMRVTPTRASDRYRHCHTDGGVPSYRHAQEALQRNRAQSVAATLAGKVAELNLGQYDLELLKLAVRHAINPAEAASHLREIQVCVRGTSKAELSVQCRIIGLPSVFTSLPYCELARLAVLCS